MSSANISLRFHCPKVMVTVFRETLKLTAKARVEGNFAPGRKCPLRIWPRNRS
jgi:hypothetical protein